MHWLTAHDIRNRMTQCLNLPASLRLEEGGIILAGDNRTPYSSGSPRRDVCWTSKGIDMRKGLMTIAICAILGFGSFVPVQGEDHPTPDQIVEAFRHGNGVTVVSSKTGSISRNSMMLTGTVAEGSQYSLVLYVEHVNNKTLPSISVDVSAPASWLNTVSMTLLPTPGAGALPQPGYDMFIRGFTGKEVMANFKGARNSIGLQLLARTSEAQLRNAAWILIKY